jgi:hypothetical protein
MQRSARWLCIFLLSALCNCRDNPPATQQQQQRAAASAIQNLDQDYSAMVAQFNAASAKVRAVIMLSPT